MSCTSSFFASRLYCRLCVCVRERKSEGQGGREPTYLSHMLGEDLVQHIVHGQGEVGVVDQ